MNDTLLKDLLDHAVHFGHRTQKWNPNIRPYIYGDRQGIHIFDLEKTAQCLEKAKAFLTKSAAEGKTILFVSTKPQAAKILTDAAQKCQVPFVIQRWIPGLITNFSTIRRRIRYLKNLEEQEKSGEFEKYTKKEALNLKKTIAKLELSLGGVKNLTDTPDVVFVVDVVRDNIAVKEAQRRRIPVVAILDSNADPAGIKYPIPGNDDAVKSLKFLIEHISQAVLAGKQGKGNKPTATVKSETKETLTTETKTEPKAETEPKAAA